MAATFDGNGSWGLVKLLFMPVTSGDRVSSNVEVPDDSNDDVVAAVGCREVVLVAKSSSTVEGTAG